MKSIIARAALAGYGGAIGRDAWRATKKGAPNALLIVLLLGGFFGAVVFPFWGGRDLTRGHDRSAMATFLLTVLFPLALLALGVGLGHVGDMWWQQMQGVKAPINPRLDVILLVSGGSFALGALYGFSQRRGRKARFFIEDHNRAFLRRRGFREEGEGEFRDGDGNLLRAVETSGTRITFLAVGKRNKRAYISTSADGAMLAYSGVMPVHQAWDGSDIEAD